jgi:hypothetical protein
MQHMAFIMHLRWLAASTIRVELVLVSICSYKPAAVHINVFAELKQIPGHNSSCLRLCQEGACYYSR